MKKGVIWITLSLLLAASLLMASCGSAKTTSTTNTTNTTKATKREEQQALAKQRIHQPLKAWWVSRGGNTCGDQTTPGAPPTWRTKKETQKGD